MEEEKKNEKIEKKPTNTAIFNAFLKQVLGPSHFQAKEFSIRTENGMMMSSSIDPANSYQAIIKVPAWQEINIDIGDMKMFKQIVDRFGDVPIDIKVSEKKDKAILSSEAKTITLPMISADYVKKPFPVKKTLPVQFKLSGDEFVEIMKDIRIGGDRPLVVVQHKTGEERLLFSIQSDEMVSAIDTFCKIDPATPEFLTKFRLFSFLEPAEGELSIVTGPNMPFIVTYKTAEGIEVERIIAPVID